MGGREGGGRLDRRRKGGNVEPVLPEKGFRFVQRLGISEVVRSNGCEGGGERQQGRLVG